MEIRSVVARDKEGVKDCHQKQHLGMVEMSIALLMDMSIAFL